jgi:hypothetical protein
MKLFLKIFLPIVVSAAFQIVSRASDFEEKVKSLGLEFSKPEGYEEVAPKQNGDAAYDYALRHPTKKYEVRYSLQPIPAGALQKYKEWSAKENKDGTIMTDPNLMFELKFRAIMANITGKGDAGPSQHFNPESVKAEFGADSGIVAPTEMNSQFGEGYKMCLLVGIHKKDIGDVFIFHLFDDLSEIKEDHMAIFYALKFPMAVN